MDLRNEIAKIIGINIQNSSSDIKYDILESVKEDGYTRELIEYDSYGDKVRAYLLILWKKCLVFHCGLNKQYF